MIKEVYPRVWKGHYDFPYTDQIVSEVLSMLNRYGFGNYPVEIGTAFSTFRKESEEDFVPHKSEYFSDFYKMFLGHLKTINPDATNFLIDKSWFNLHRKTGKTKEHHHGLIDHVCAFYLKAPPNSGRFEIHEKDKIVPIEISTNDYLIFQGNMIHGSEVSNSNEDRIVVTTNVFARYF